MTQIEIEYTSGSSNTGLPKRTVGAWLLGNDKARSDVGKFLFHPNKRTYKRRRKVWACNQCVRGSTRSDQVSQLIANIIVGAVLLIGALIYFS
jgi:hypothetical protein